MVAGASDVDSSTCYTSSSSSIDEDDHEHGKDRRHMSKNFNRLSFVTTSGFCAMARNSGSKRSEKDDSDSDSEDEVTDDLDIGGWDT